LRKQKKNLKLTKNDVTKPSAEFLKDRSDAPD